MLVRVIPFPGRTLRRTLVVSIVTLFVLVTVATGAISWWMTQRSMADQLDLRVLQAADRAGGRGDGPGRGGMDRPGAGLGGDFLLLRVQGGHVRLFTAYTQDGKRVDTQADAQGALDVLLAADLPRRPTTVDLGEPYGRYRLVQTGSGADRTITGLPTAPVEAAAAQVALVTSLAGLAGLVVLLAGTTWLVRANLRPLDRVAAVAAHVSETPMTSGDVDLTERVPAADTDRRTEVGQVGAALNDLLDTVAAALTARHESETQLRRFVADASHELRTPLASIRGYAELSRRETAPVPDGVRHALSRIDSESARMASLVEDLLLLARLDAGRPLATEPVDLTLLVIDAVSDARAAGPAHTWQLELPDAAVETTGDPARLTQVVVNLLANARVHTPPGTTVTAAVRTEPGAAVLTVTDDGPGIPAEILPRVFARFTRGDEARTRVADAEGRPQVPSTGLGLSIVSAVVAAHRGTVTVDSTPGRTTFTVRLPR